MWHGPPILARAASKSVTSSSVLRVTAPCIVQPASPTPRMASAAS